MRLRRRATHLYSHRREIQIDISLLASPRSQIDTAPTHCILLPHEFPQFGFQLRYCKLPANRVSIKMIVLYSYLPTFLFLGLSDSDGIVRQIPAVLVPRKRSIEEEYPMHTILGDVEMESIMGKKMVLILVPTDDSRYTLGESTSVTNFTKYVGLSLAFQSWNMVHNIESFLCKIWADVVKNQVLRKNFETLDERVGAEGRFRIKCVEGTCVKVSLKRMKNTAHYFQAFENFQNTGRMSLEELDSGFRLEVVMIFLEFAYTSRLPTGTCTRLYNDSMLFAECLEFAEYYMAPTFQIYLRFLLTWRIVSHPRKVRDLFVLYPFIVDQKIQVIADALLAMARKSDPEYAKSAEEYPELANHVKWLDEDNFFVTRFNSDFPIYWNV
jgi:hypothetical protein